MPSVQFTVWRFQDDQTDGVEVGGAIRTETTGKEVWARVCKDVAAVIAADCRRRGNPSSYGIAMTFRVRDRALPQTAIPVEGPDEQLEILPEKDQKASPAREKRGRRKQGAE